MRKTTSDIDYLADLGKVVKAYEEIAAFRMRNIKERVLKNRQFVNELNDVFYSVKISYQKMVEKYKASGKRKNGKTARVFLSSNTGLYGDMVQRVFGLFLSDFKKSSSDVIIIGRLGKSLFESSHLSTNFIYFELPDKEMVLEEIKKMVDFLIPYETVIVYYGLFKNIIMQEAVSTNVSGDIQLEPEKKQPTRKLIFEPSVPQILDFFESEIFSSLLMHVIFESQLAKFSSRMSALEQANENIRRETAFARIEAAMYKKRFLDKKQLETLAGRALWEQ